ncbi:T9SS type A sorting domain-containing protein [Lentimicrobium sp. S6]|uniref:T9SS type A sorting domain-containing protein n=1 Tax=Lentimicrobium sp. S6 TaxID=2735872 RepID=UPI0015528E48|nr:T9SS type A sorting domain-containing protein [Lentimicrobium sp. S6]NPD48184.1 T9SS type A sorting domain-containing protein [Lentimicrobium sp. S6]
MKKLIIISLFLLFCFQSHAQNWIEPTFVTKTSGGYLDPEFCIDHEGVIHCVWQEVYNTDYSQIFCSNSHDNGLTWADAINISQNSEYRVSSPHIVCDSENNLHLSYDYNSNSTSAVQIYYQSFNGEEWSEPIELTPNTLCSYRNKLFIDHNDRVYCFWYRGVNNGTSFYKFKNDDSWSDIITPYDNSEFHFFNDAVVDSDNNLHWIGNHHYQNEGSYDIKPIYFFYDYENDEWSDFEEFGEGYSWNGFDIDLDNSENPHLVWQEKIPQVGEPPLNTTYYNAQNEYGIWDMPTYLGDGRNNQRIIIDYQNRPNVFHREKNEIEDKWIVIYYYKNVIDWESSIFPVENSINEFEILKQDMTINMVFTAITSFDNNMKNVMFTRTDMINHINTLEPSNKLEISPNPSRKNFNINFDLENEERVNIQIYNLQGELIKKLYDDEMLSGNHQLEWNPKDEGRQLNSGLYFIRLQTDQTISTQKLEFIR